MIKYDASIMLQVLIKGESSRKGLYPFISLAFGIVGPAGGPHEGY